MAADGFKKIFSFSENNIWFPVIFLFLIAEIIVNPIGEFCLNDDWAYSKVVYNYLNTGELRLSFWQAIPGLPLIYTGIVFSKVFGFSFTLLRFVSIGCVVITTFILDINLKTLGLNVTKRLMVLLLFVFNPLTLSLCNSFMPDIFQLCLAIAAYHFINRFLIEQNFKNLFLFTLFSVMATLNRQTGIVLPVGFLLFMFFGVELNKKNIITALFPFLISMLALWIFEYHAKQNGNLPPNYNLQLANTLTAILNPDFDTLKRIGYYIITSTICLGLFVLPITVSHFPEALRLLRGRFLLGILLLIYLALIGVKILFSGNFFPFVGNMFYHLGVGPVILTGYSTDQDAELPGYINCIWIGLNIIGGLSFFVSLSSLLTVKWREKLPGSFSVFLFFSLLIFYLLPISFSYANDRYLLFLIPFYFMAYVLSLNRETSRMLFVFLFVPLFFFSVAGTHDYLSINKAKTRASDYLVRNKRVLPSNIDGGFEFNGWNSESAEGYIPSHKGRWWFIKNDDYIISPVKLKGYTIDSAIGFKTWISFPFDSLLIQRRLPL